MIDKINWWIVVALIVFTAIAYMLIKGLRNDKEER
jgi:hypothetical protein